jgi:exonuclease SbcD
MYLAIKPTCLTLRDGDGQMVQFVLMPYPTAHRYLAPEVQPESVEQKHTLLRSAVLAQLGALRERLDEQYASVLVAHLNVRGSELHNLYKLTEKEDVTFDLGDLPLQWAYIALGHIHKPQSIGGIEHMCYSGSIERMDLGERSDNKSVIFIEIKSGQRCAGPTRLPLHATPIYKFEINDPEREIPALAARFPDGKEALAYYTLRYRPGTHNSNTLIKKINAHFRACCYCEAIPEGSEPGSLAAVEQTQVKSVPDQVKSYLEGRLLPNDPDRAELLALAEQLLSEGA